MAEQIRSTVIDALTQIAPEVDATALDGAADLQDELDLDSMDMLNLVTLLAERLGVDIPERDYAELRTLDATIAYLERVAAPTG